MICKRWNTNNAVLCVLLFASAGVTDSAVLNTQGKCSLFIGRMHSDVWRCKHRETRLLWWLFGSSADIRRRKTQSTNHHTGLEHGDTTYNPKS